VNIGPKLTQSVKAPSRKADVDHPTRSGLDE
jgi:hypothetical protein